MFFNTSFYWKNQIYVYLIYFNPEANFDIQQQKKSLHEQILCQCNKTFIVNFIDKVIYVNLSILQKTNFSVEFSIC